MGALARFASWLRRSADVDAGGIPWHDASSFSVPSVTGLSINQHSALAASAVLACVTMLAEDVAKLPWSIFKVADDGSDTEATDHFLFDLLQEPNDWQNGLEFREMLMVSLILRGNAYAVILRDARGRPRKLVPVNADQAALWQAPGGELFYRVTPTNLHEIALFKGLPQLLPSEDVFHLRGFSLNGLLGVSRIAVAREAIALGIAQEQQAARWMGSGAKPSGVLTTEQKLTKEAAERVSADWKKLFSGLSNSGKTAVLEQGLKFEKLDMTSADLEFIASRKFQIEEIARIFRIPMHMIGELSRSTNNNIAQQAQEYINFTLTGYTSRWCAKLSSTFGLRKAKLAVKFDYRALTTADMQTRINNFRTMIMSMMATPDEARIDLGLKPMGGEAAKLHYPQNMAAGGSQSTGTGADGAGRPANGDPPA